MTDRMREKTLRDHCKWKGITHSSFDVEVKFIYKEISEDKDS